MKYDNRDVKSGFMKIFLTSGEDAKGNPIDIDLEKRRAGLIYEQKLYELIRVCIRLNYCPYFVHIYSNAGNCSLTQFLNLINIQGKVSDAQIQGLYWRSYLHMLIRASMRPSLTDTSGTISKLEKENVATFIQEYLQNLLDPAKRKLNRIEVDAEILEELKIKLQNDWNIKNQKFNFMINEPITGKTGFDLVPFYTDWEYKDSVSFKAFLNMIFLQLFITFYGLHLLKFNHNDIHPGNFWITSVPRRNVRYKIEDAIYEFDNLGIEVKVYDFDYSHCDVAGNNTFLEKHKYTFMCQDYNVCNEFVPKRDFKIVSQKLISELRDIRRSGLKNDAKEVVSQVEKDVFKSKDIGSVYENVDLVKEPLEIVHKQLEIVSAKKISGEQKCPYVFKKGKNKDKTCGEPVVIGKTFCKTHKKYEGKVKVEMKKNNTIIL